MKNLLEELTAYGASDYYGFHMPGHKRNRELQEKMKMSGVNLFQMDITEIRGFDDLHHAEGILKDAQEQAAKLYHAEETHFLVNGSTAGILSSILAVTQRGDTIIVARNCHKSVYHAIYLNELHPVYVYPEYDSRLGLNTEVEPEKIRQELQKHPQAKAVMIVSPTYDGVVSDVAAIAKICHESGVPLIVDEAHGAHFGFHPYFPDNANTKGADLVIHSVHKTLPALTQTALLHMNGVLADRERVRMYLHIVQTSSPSYVLMASIAQCMDLLSDHREEVFKPYVNLLIKTRRELETMKHLRLIRTEHYDPSKLVISVSGTRLSAGQLYERLWFDYHLEFEMVAGTYLLAMTTVGDTPEGMERLVRALRQIDAELGDEPKEQQKENTEEKTEGKPAGEPVGKSEGEPEGEPAGEPEGISLELPVQEQCMTIAEAVSQMSKRENTVRKPFAEAGGYISTEYAYLYPPGIPILVPGERIRQKATGMLQWYQEHSFTIEGLKDPGVIEVLAETEE